MTEFVLRDNVYYQMGNVELNSNYSVETWDISDTIKQLAYLTHDYFRYYGKFPSKVANNILDDLVERKKINYENDFVFDNYLGSGTTLVESKLKKFDSMGIDINPLGVLSSRVKTKNLDVNQLKSKWYDFTERIAANIDTDDENIITSHANQGYSIEREVIESTISEVRSNFKDIDKWFTEKTINDLAVIKTILLQMEENEYREFFVTGFFAIIRRVSVAYDGEVRPHVNKMKRQRDVKSAFTKKINEMITTMVEWNHETLNKDVNIKTETYLSDNREHQKVQGLVNSFSESVGKELGLVISHPPYLNCFEYIPVYKLELLWGYGFNEIYTDEIPTFADIRSMETKSWPANTETNINKYFESNRSTYELVYSMLRDGGYCCIVIGDCTIRKELFKVHKSIARICEEIGFTVEKIVYRTTHYGTGKYAYNFRADYHEEEESKKDAIIFLKK